MHRFPLQKSPIKEVMFCNRDLYLQEPTNHNHPIGPVCTRVLELSEAGCIARRGMSPFHTQKNPQKKSPGDSGYIANRPPQLPNAGARAAYVRFLSECFLPKWHLGVGTRVFVVWGGYD